MTASVRRPGAVRYRLTGAAGGLLALGGIGFLVWLTTNRSLFIGLTGVFTAAVAVDGWHARRAVRHLEVDLVPPPVASAWQPTRWELRCTGWTRPVTVTPLLVSAWSEQLLDDPRPAMLAWPPMARGTIPFVVFDAVAGGPLGLVLAGRRLVLDFAEPLRLGPAPLEIDGRWPRPLPVGFGPVEGAPVGEELFRAIRPYLRGDDRRRVDWKSTARHGSLMVRELDGTGAVLIRIVVDLGPPGPAAEHTASVAAWVANAALAQKWRVELVTLDASAWRPSLVDIGRVFTRPPAVVVPVPGPLPTVVAPVRTPDDVRFRLATAAYGSPTMPATRGPAGRVRHVSQHGLAWT